MFTTKYLLHVTYDGVTHWRYRMTTPLLVCGAANGSDVLPDQHAVPTCIRCIHLVQSFQDGGGPR